jgi:hypothetical protein
MSLITTRSSLCSFFPFAVRHFHSTGHGSFQISVLFPGSGMRPSGGSLSTSHLGPGTLRRKRQVSPPTSPSLRVLTFQPALLFTVKHTNEVLCLR